MKSIPSLVLVAMVLAISACAGKTARHSPTVSPTVTQAVDATPPSTPSLVRIDDTVVPDPAAAGSEAVADAEALYPLEVSDPWERYNRRMYTFNTKVDKYVARPIGVAYDKVVPDVAQRRVKSFFSNLQEPRNLVNQLLQGHPIGATKTLGRLLVNTTAGIGGLFDPASRLKLHRANEDFGQTLAVWGWDDSRYFIMPTKGPGTIRDFIASYADAPAAPSRYLDHDGIRMGLKIVQLGSMRAGALPLDNMRTAVPDEYIFVRDAWLQRRKHLIEERR